MSKNVLRIYTAMQFAYPFGVHYKSLYNNSVLIQNK